MHQRPCQSELRCWKGKVPVSAVVLLHKLIIHMCTVQYARNSCTLPCTSIHVHTDTHTCMYYYAQAHLQKIVYIRTYIRVYAYNGRNMNQKLVDCFLKIFLLQCCPIKNIWESWQIKIDFDQPDQPNAEIGRKMANNRLLFLALCLLNSFLYPFRYYKQLEYCREPI